MMTVDYFDSQKGTTVTLGVKIVYSREALEDGTEHRKDTFVFLYDEDGEKVAEGAAWLHTGTRNQEPDRFRAAVGRKKAFARAIQTYTKDHNIRMQLWASFFQKMGRE
jgi:hypothetical protein